MQDTAKYLVHADITADGVVERSDVVGAVFGQTEGLLGDELDLRTLQQSSKLGRIDVEVESEGGQSFGAITIASSLDKVETAILAAALETIDRIGPCRAHVEVTAIEDVRAAKRREVIARAKELLGGLDETVMTSQELIEAVRESVRVEDITEYQGLPAGPRVADSDAIIVVEGRADVLALLGYGVKNAVAVEGTNVPEAVADLTRERTVTAFLDGDRGGDLILKELAQVGSVDYVAFAPPGRSVEDLSRGEVMEALREKAPYETVVEASAGREDVAATDGSSRPVPPGTAAGTDGTADAGNAGDASDAGDAGDAGDADATSDAAGPDTDAVASTRGAKADAEEANAELDAEAEEANPEAEVEAEVETGTAAGGSRSGTSSDADDAPGERADDGAAEESEDGDGTETTDGQPDDEPDEPETLRGHVREVVGGDTGLVRLLDPAFGTLAEAPAGDAFDAIAEAETVPASVVIDGELSQRVLDVAAQRGVDQVVAREEGQYVKKPTSVRVRTADQLTA